MEPVMAVIKAFLHGYYFMEAACPVYKNRRGLHRQTVAIADHAAGGNGRNQHQLMVVMHVDPMPPVSGGSAHVKIADSFFSGAVSKLISVHGITSFSCIIAKLQRVSMSKYSIEKQIRGVFAH